MSNAHASRLSMLMGIATLLTDCFAKGVTEEFESNPLSAAGAGDLWMESVLGKMSSMLPGQAVGLPHFSEEAAHLLLAAADYLLVPSRFEPCGLVALCALRYGAVPIVTPAGGMQDIVTPKVS